jgi:hypothetical protein
MAPTRVKSSIQAPSSDAGQHQHRPGQRRQHRAGQAGGDQQHAQGPQQHRCCSHARGSFRSDGNAPSVGPAPGGFKLAHSRPKGMAAVLVVPSGFAPHFDARAGACVPSTNRRPTMKTCIRCCPGPGPGAGPEHRHRRRQAPGRRQVHGHAARHACPHRTRQHAGQAGRTGAAGRPGTGAHRRGRAGAAAPKRNWMGPLAGWPPAWAWPR